MVNKKFSILKEIKNIIMIVSLSGAIAFAVVKGQGSTDYKKLPKAQQKQVDILRTQDITESAIRSDMEAFNKVASDLKEIERAINNENYFIARGLISDAERIVNTIKHLKNSKEELMSRLVQLDKQIKSMER